MIIKYTKVFIILLIVVVSFIVRKANYAEIPIPGQSTDEYSYSWVGLSLIKTGMPVGISGMASYKNQLSKYINVDRYTQYIPSDPLSINYPWMDHPPLLGLITGGYAYLAGAEVFEDTIALYIRRPIIVISTISVLLVIVFCWINFNYFTGLLAGLIYGSTPLVVLSSRMIQAETAIIPMLLLTLIFISLYLKGHQDRWLILAGLTSGIATLFKLTGVTSALSVFLILLLHYRKFNQEYFRDVVFFSIISFSVSFLFLIYGSVYGISNFLSIQFSNANRFYGIGPGAIFDLIRQQRLTQHKFLPEIWIISGWIVSIFYLFKKSKNVGLNILIIALFSYLLTYLFFGSQPYGWYSFPFWPILIMILSYFLTSVFKNKNILAVSLVSLTILGANMSRLYTIFEFQNYAQIWRIITPVFLLVILIKHITKLKYKNTKYLKLLFMIIWLWAIYLNFKYLNLINIDFWWQNIS